MAQSSREKLKVQSTGTVSMDNQRITSLSCRTNEHMADVQSHEPEYQEGKRTVCYSQIDLFNIEHTPKCRYSKLSTTYFCLPPPGPFLARGPATPAPLKSFPNDRPPKPRAIFEAGLRGSLLLPLGLFCQSKVLLSFLGVLQPGAVEVV